MWVTLAAAAASMPWRGEAALPVGGLLPFTETELNSILSHGPWPQPWSRDPSNRASGTPEAIRLGEQLFFDSRLSPGGKASCSTCHVPERNWTDNLKRGVAIGEMDRNTPSLVNLRSQRWFGWDGAADSLWAQSIRPMLDRREFAASPAHVAQFVRGDGEIACRYEKVFGTHPSASADEAVLVGVAKALAAFQETLTSGYTSFDAFRDALARGDGHEAARYSEAAQRGLRIFIGKGACNTCHAGPNFSSGEFRHNGVAAADRADAGRYEGVKRLKDSRFNLVGPYNDDASRANARGTLEAVADERDSGKFKVPSLRNAVLTAPYMHAGQHATLADVVRHYSELDAGRVPGGVGRAAGPLKLSAVEVNDLVVFLETLTAASVQWRGGEGPSCQ
jgi:cytochrome c peroxidase